MKNTNCDSIMNNYLELDSNSHLPINITMHFLTCKKCRTQVRALTKADRLCKEQMSIPVPLTDDTLISIMNKIDPSFAKLNASATSPISMKKWIIAGILMIVGMLFFGISDYATNLQLSIAFYLVFAGAVTAYCGLFIGCNMDFFIKKLNNLSIQI